MKAVEFAPPARDEFDAAVDWYESQAEGVGRRFVQSVAETLEHIAEAPLESPVWHDDTRFRKAVVHRFPYVVFYRDLPKTIEVVAVAHGAREPGYWLGRK
ncbi:MAG: hypothetical protein AMXMBFR56_10490 [Polyangiaceae bacterium]